MLVRANIFPVARSPKATKKGSKEVTFINSYYGKKDDDGLFSETKTVSCWMPQSAADVLKANMKVDALLDIMGEIIMLREFTVAGKLYTVNDNGQADLSGEPEDEKPKGHIGRV